MNFKQWLIKEMAWAIGEESRRNYEIWKKVAKNDSGFARVPWLAASKIMEKMGMSEFYSQKVKKEQGIPEENTEADEYVKEWAAKEFIKDHTDVVLAKVDPCKLMQLRSFRVSKPDISDKFYINQFSQENDVDPGLPLCIVNLEGVSLYDGNHRMTSACELKQAGYVAIAYFMSIDPVKSAIIEIIK